MKKMKRFLILALALLAGAAQAFAGGGQARGQQTQQAAQDLGARGSGPNYWMVKYPQPVTLHVVSEEYQHGDPVPESDPAYLAWDKLTKEKLNIDFVTDWVAPVGQYGTKLNLAIASKDLPDYFACNGAQFTQLLEAGLIADITDYVENNLSDTVKAIMAYEPVVTESAKRNGRLYAVPIYSWGPLSEPEEIWIRRDWLAASGLQAPKTIAELETVMQTFMRQHPGTYGTPLRKDLTELNWLAPAFKAYPGWWISGSDGSIVYGSVQNEMKNVLQTFADWYKKGYLKQDWMSSDYDSNLKDAIAGKYGVNVFQQWWGYAHAADMTETYGREVYMEAYDLPSFDGSPVNQFRPFGNATDNASYGYIVYNKNCKNLAAALKCASVYNYVNDAVEQGIMSADYVGDVYRRATGRKVPEIQNPIAEDTMFRQVQAWKKSGDKSVLKIPQAISAALEIQTWLDSGARNAAGRWSQLYMDHCSYEVNARVLDNKRWVNDRLTGPLPDDVAAYGSTLNDLLTEGFVKIIVGQQPISYFDTLVAQWKAAGGDACVQSINRVYGKK